MTKDQLEQAIRNYMRVNVCPKCISEARKEEPDFIDCAFSYNHDEDLCDKAKLDNDGMTFLKEFVTTQCCVIVYDTNTKFLDEKVYCIVSVHTSNGNKTIRFGTEEQIKQICNTYNLEKKFTLGSKNEGN